MVQLVNQECYFEPYYVGPVHRGTVIQTTEHTK